MGTPSESLVIGGSSIHGGLTVNGQESLLVDLYQFLADHVCLEGKWGLSERRLFDGASTESGEDIKHILSGFGFTPESEWVKVLGAGSVKVIVRKVSESRTAVISPSITIKLNICLK